MDLDMHLFVCRFVVQKLAGSIVEAMREGMQKDMCSSMYVYI